MTLIRPPELMQTPRAAGSERFLFSGTRLKPSQVPSTKPQRLSLMLAPPLVRVTSMFGGVAKRCRSSSPESCAPLPFVSTKTNQPQSQLLVPDASAQPLEPVGSFRMVMLPPRLMASERAKYSVDCSPSTACRTRQRSIRGVKLGAAIAASTAMMATTTMTSSSVKPCACRWGRVRGGRCVAQ